nr:hypothetical protein [Nitrobacter hamburgensis]
MRRTVYLSRPVTTAGVPIPQFATWDAFNTWLEEQCCNRQRDRLRGENETIGGRLQRDLAVMRGHAFLTALANKMERTV